jgi:hypothetical protein
MTILRIWFLLLLSFALVALGCDEDPVVDDAGTDAGAEMDAGAGDAGAEDAGAEDAGLEDAGPEDAGPEDAGPEDAGPEDAGPEDAGVIIVMPDAGSEPDAGPVDAGLSVVNCPEFDLGSMVGMGVAANNLFGATDDSDGSCRVPGPLGGGPDVAYTFTAPAEATYTISTAGTLGDTVLYVLDGSCTGGEIACNDDIDASSLDFASEVAVDLALNQTVVIVVDAGGPTGFPFELSIEQSEGTCDDMLDDDGDGLIDCDDPDCRGVPACTETICDDMLDDEGDGLIDCDDPDCEASTLCTPSCALPPRNGGSLGSALGTLVATGSTSGLSSQGISSCGGGGGPDVIYYWVAPNSGTYTFDTCSGSSYDTRLWLAADCAALDAGTNIGCNDDSCGLQSRVSRTMVAGEGILIGVDGFSTSSQGTYGLSISGPP